MDICLQRKCDIYTIMKYGVMQSLPLAVVAYLVVMLIVYLRI